MRPYLEEHFNFFDGLVEEHAGQPFSYSFDVPRELLERVVAQRDAVRQAAGRHRTGVRTRAAARRDGAEPARAAEGDPVQRPAEDRGPEEEAPSRDLLAAAHEAGVDFTMQDIDRLSRQVPCLCKVAPAKSDVHMEDVHRAGGIMGILGELNRAGLLPSKAQLVRAERIDPDWARPRLIRQWRDAAPKRWLKAWEVAQGLGMTDHMKDP